MDEKKGGADNSTSSASALAIVNEEAVSCYKTGYQWFYPSWSERITQFHSLLTRHNELSALMQSEQQQQTAEAAALRSERVSRREGLTSLLSTVIGILSGTFDVSRLMFPRIVEEQMNLYGRVHVRPPMVHVGVACR